MRVGTEMHNVKSFPADLYNEQDVFHEKTLRWEGIVGTMDEYYRGIILDKKTCRALPGKPKDGHVLQLQCYQVLAEMNGMPVTSLVVQYIDVNNCFFRNFVLTPLKSTDALAAQMIQRKEVLLEAMNREDPPVREPQWCEYCSYGQICYGVE
jgi:CRISPR/Cas system-associated exonuclease Cas4 (RecB family)